MGEFLWDNLILFYLVLKRKHQINETNDSECVEFTEYSEECHIYTHQVYKANILNAIYKMDNEG